MVGKKKLLIIDVMNVVYRTVFTANKEDPLDKKFLFWKHLFLDTILSYIKQFEPDRCIMAIDDKYSWRKSIYPEYKAHRKKARAKSPVDFDSFHPVLDEYMEQLKTVFSNIHFIKVANCEADDIIAIITKERTNEFNVVNISVDSDMFQLMKFRNYKQFDSRNNNFFAHINAEKELTVKILTGDSSDNIQGVIERCGPVKANKLLEEGLDDLFKNGHDITKQGEHIHIEGSEIEANFKRNKQLIDLSMIPYEYEEKILDVYDNYVINKSRRNKVFNFLTDNRLVELMDRFEQYTPYLKNIE